jgi:hypothetical protein
MVDKILKQEAYDSYRFLIDYTNFNEGSKGYGLTLDRSSGKESSSVAGSGFMLSGLVIGVKQYWDDYEINLKRAKLTLNNFYYNIPHYEGLLVHYAEYETGKRYRKSEFSTIDTILFVNGMLMVDSFFDDEEIHKYTRLIYERINWDKFVFERHGRKVFRMAYNDIQGGDYLAKEEHGWIYHWSMYAEQLTMYILAAGSDKIDEVTAKELYLGFDRSTGGYNENQFIFTPGGPIFTHQYSHAWFDFENYQDIAGYNWFRNSVAAIKGHFEYAQDLKDTYKTFSAGFWGLSPCDGPNGYTGYGAPPFENYDYVSIRGTHSRVDGTVAIYAIVASLPFVPELVKSTVAMIEEKFPELKGDYGYFDAINLEKGLWIAKDYISIDKGITLLMIDNYYNRTSIDYYTKHPIIQSGIKKLDFRKRSEKKWQQ